MLSFLLFCVYVLLGFELRAYTLSHSTNPLCVCVCVCVCVKGFSRLGLMNYLPWLASNDDPPYFCLLSS
jgi:hypothetical protein